MISCHAFCQCHDKVPNLLTYVLLEFKYLSGKKEKFLFDQISDKPTAKKLFLINHYKSFKNGKIILATWKIL